MSEPILEVRGLKKSYGTVTAVDGVSFAVSGGVCFGLLGPNGAGKTTTIEIMEGILSATSGEVRYRGEPLGRRSREDSGILFQKTALQDFLTVRQSLTLFRHLYARGHSVDALIKLCALEKLQNRDTRKLSGGQQQRLLLAIALANDPAVLFLDEPTTGLDPLSRNEMWEVVRGLSATGVTVLLTTQYLEEADQLAEDIAVVDHGTVIATGTPDELKARTGAQTLSVRPASPADVPAVTAIVAGFSPAEPEVRNTTVTVPVSQEDVLPSVMRRFENAGIRVAELNLRGSTLDEVFLSLTGRRTETEAQAEVLEGSAA